MFAKLENLERRFEDLEQQLTCQDVLSDQERYRKLSIAHAELKEVVDTFRRYKTLQADLRGNRELLSDSDPDIRAMAQDEIKNIETLLP